ncbi:MAG: ATP-binding protein, partial [Magnetococcales bacterium]|nr:ATP-binding protein [Magnetococcales bacterium]
MEPKPLRVFISSPSDVSDERRRAAVVISRLNKEFTRFFHLLPVLWEYEPMLASGHFQDSIERPSQTEIFVMIVWARMGTLLPTDRFQGMGGRVPVTGTEWEYEEALQSSRDRGVPDLLVYRKTGEAVAKFGDEEELEQVSQQWKALQVFWKRHFVNDDGQCKVAFNTFSDLNGFEAQLEDHLRQLISRKVSEATISSGGIIWGSGSPFLGLKTFDASHAPIFFGREQAEREVIDLLAKRSEAGTTFLLILGESGSGKSSLIRAGVLPQLSLPGVISGVRWWRYCFFRPSEAEGDLWTALAQAVLQKDALPELADLRPEELGAQWQAVPTQGSSVFRLAMNSISKAQSIDEAGTEGRLVLVVDQLEELFTLPAITAEEREKFIEFLSALAHSGLVWVIAAMRSDFFNRSAEIPLLRDLAAGNGQYHLLPPRLAEIEQIIRKPAALANIGFEIDAVSGLGLDAILHEEAFRDKSSLPLLEFALDELYRKDVEKGDKRLLTLASYREMGGLTGAIARHADEICSDMVEMEAKALRAVLLSLVTIHPKGKICTSRLASRQEIESVAERAKVLERLVQARLVVTSGDDESSRVRLAHESLIVHWKRLGEMIEDNRSFLKALAGLEVDTQAWLDNNQDSARLLPGGKRLADAQELLLQRSDDLPRHVIQYIESSIHQEHLVRDQRLRRARWVAIAMSGLTMIASGFGWYAYVQKIAATNSKEEALKKAEEAKRERLTAVMRLISEMNNSGDHATAVKHAMEEEADLPKRVVKNIKLASYDLGAIVGGNDGDLDVDELHQFKIDNNEILVYQGWHNGVGVVDANNAGATGKYHCLQEEELRFVKIVLPRRGRQIALFDEGMNQYVAMNVSDCSKKHIMLEGILQKGESISAINIIGENNIFVGTNTGSIVHNGRRITIPGDDNIKSKVVGLFLDPGPSRLVILYSNNIMRMISIKSGSEISVLNFGYSRNIASVVTNSTQWINFFSDLPANKATYYRFHPPIGKIDPGTMLVISPNSRGISFYIIDLKKNINQKDHHLVSWVNTSKDGCNYVVTVSV